ncbi:MBL fold metallo-hydrolase [Reinekea sp.]|uniref:MBL fold metallo-hydrolase n=1 Tax=Reinekea sp. TaxID=1970455 RepID=UPI003988D786
MKTLVLSFITFYSAFVVAEQPVLSFSFITTSHANPTAEAFLVKGGRMWHKRALIQGAVLVQYDDTLFLYDAGLGQDIDEQFEGNSWLDKKIFAHSEVKPVIQQLSRQKLSAADISFIVPSHLHWDHASGLPDFDATPIWVQEHELSAARRGQRPSFLPSTLVNDLNWQTINLNSGPLFGFDRSLDIFGDGKVVLVELPGHTAGQLGLYLEVSVNERYFFVGDASWTSEGIRENKKRSWLIRKMVKLNDDEHQSDETLLKLNELSINDPELIIVPVHDERLIATLPQYPEGIKWKSEL